MGIVTAGQGGPSNGLTSGQLENNIGVGRIVDAIQVISACITSRWRKINTQSRCFGTPDCIIRNVKTFVGGDAMAIVVNLEVMTCSFGIGEERSQLMGRAITVGDWVGRKSVSRTVLQERANEAARLVNENVESITFSLPEFGRRDVTVVTQKMTCAKNAVARAPKVVNEDRTRR